MTVCQRVLCTSSRSFYEHKLLADKTYLKCLCANKFTSDKVVSIWRRQTSLMCVFVGKIYVQVDFYQYASGTTITGVTNHPNLWSTTLNQDVINSERSRFHETCIVSAWERDGKHINFMCMSMGHLCTLEKTQPPSRELDQLLLIMIVVSNSYWWWTWAGFQSQHRWADNVLVSMRHNLFGGGTTTSASLFVGCGWTCLLMLDALDL